MKTTKSKYDADTIHRLRESIAHWERHRDGKADTDEEIFATDCALCKRFNTFENECAGCPVMECTGQANCKGSPWVEASAEYNEYSYKQSEAFKAAAAKQVEFLKSLLP